MVLALSNSLQIPILLLTSIPDSPILTVQPRSVQNEHHLILAYNQYALGHYDAMGYTTSVKKEKRKDGCRCGVSDKANISRCCENTGYVCRSPCFKAGKECTEHCRCKSCNNPNGSHLTVVPLTGRKRQQHELKSLQCSSAEFMKSRGEEATHGQWSTVENFIFFLRS